MHSSSVSPAVPVAASGTARQFSIAVLMLTALGLLLRLIRLDNQSLWIDECLSIAWVQSIEVNGWRSLLHNIHGPLHAVILWVASRVSMGEWWLRLPSVLAGTAAIPALALLGRALCGPRIGLTAAGLLTLSPFALYYAQECRNYSLTILFASLTLLAAWNLARRPAVSTVVLFLVAELLGVASNLNGVFLALGLNLWLLYAWRNRRRMVMLWLGLHLIVALPFVPYIQQVQQQVHIERLFGVKSSFGEEHRLRGETTLHPMALPYSAFAFAAGYSLGPTLEELRRDPSSAAQARHLPALFLTLFGFGIPLIAGVLWRRDATSAHATARDTPALAPLLTALVFVAGITLWLAAANMKPFNVRYLSVLLPVFLLLVARGFWNLPRRVSLLLLAAALIVSLWSSYNYLFVPRYGRDDTRGVVEYLRQKSTPSDLIVHINLILPMRYYDCLEARVIHARPGSGDSPEAAQRYVEELRKQKVTTLWYLECRPEAADPQGYLRQALSAAAIDSEVHRFTGIQLYRFRFPS